MGKFRCGAKISDCFCCLCEILLCDPAESDSASSSDSGGGGSSSSNESASGSESEDSEGGSESDEEEEEEDEKEKKKKKKKELKKPFQESERLQLLLCNDDGPRSDWRMWIELNDFL